MFIYNVSVIQDIPHMNSEDQGGQGASLTWSWEIGRTGPARFASKGPP